MAVEQNIDLDQYLLNIFTGQGAPLGRYDLENTADDFVPITKRTVCYIVCGIILNENGEVLMMQEAKTSCRGKWYLPAGRMELNETISEGAQREMLEETGVSFEPSSLLSVEIGSGFWYRFTFIGHVTGGELKTEPDSESLQAKWLPTKLVYERNVKEYPIRAGDIRPLVKLAEERKSRLLKGEAPPELLPVIQPHKKMVLRLACVFCDESVAHVVVSEDGGGRLPQMQLLPGDWKFEASVFKLLMHVFKEEFKTLSTSIKGLLSVEHSGKPSAENDGACLTVLISVKRSASKDTENTPENNPNIEPPSIRNKVFVWYRSENSQVQSIVNEKLSPNKTVPLLLI